MKSPPQPSDADDLSISNLNLGGRRHRQRGGGTVGTGKDSAGGDSKSSKRSSSTTNTRNTRNSQATSRRSKIIHTAKRGNLSKPKSTDEDSVLKQASKLHARKASSKASKQSKSKGTPSSAKVSKTDTAIREGAYFNDNLTENTELPIPKIKENLLPLETKGTPYL